MKLFRVLFALAFSTGVVNSKLRGGNEDKIDIIHRDLKGGKDKKPKVPKLQVEVEVRKLEEAPTST